MRLLGMLSPNSSSRLFLRFPPLVFHCSPSNIYDPTYSIYFFFVSLRILWHFRRSFSHSTIFQETLSGPFIFLRRGVTATFTRRCEMDDSRKLRTKFQWVFIHFHLSFVCVSAWSIWISKKVRWSLPRLAHNAPVNHLGARQKAEFNGKKSVTTMTFYGRKGLGFARLIDFEWIFTTTRAPTSFWRVD